MNSKDFTTALEIISKYDSTEWAIITPSNTLVRYIEQSRFRLHLKKCVPAVINNLIKEGFILRMGPEGLEVEKI